MSTKSGTVQEGIHLFGNSLGNQVIAKDGVTRQDFERFIMEFDPQAPKKWQVRGALAGISWAKENPDLLK